MQAYNSLKGSMPMKKFITLKCELESIEKQKKDIILREQAITNEIIEWGKNYFTTEKREEILARLEAEKTTSKALCNELKNCHSRWDEEIDVQDILKFAFNDINITSCEYKNYDNKFVDILYSLFFRGDE